MKRIVFICIMLFAVISAEAQNMRGFVSTGENVNVRKGPGMRYAVVEGEGGKIQLFKGEVVIDKGKKKNGFCHIQVNRVDPGSAYFNYDGWVSARYLRAVKLCSECEGTGYVGEIEELEECEKCQGKGFVE